MMSANFDVKLLEQDGISILTVRGAVDAFVFSLFREKLRDVIESGAYSVVIDLSECPNMSTACIGFIVSQMVECRENGGDLIIAGLNDHLQKIIRLVGALKLFTCSKDVEKALALLRGKK